MFLTYSQTLNVYGNLSCLKLEKTGLDCEEMYYFWNFLFGVTVELKC